MKQKMVMWWLMLCALLAHLTAYATATAISPSIQVVGLFKNTAIIRHNNHETIMRVGVQTSNGLRLVEADSNHAIFEFQGRRVSHTLSDSPVLSLTGNSSPAQVRIVASNGSYTLSGSINGQSEEFILDTGATYVTMSASQADQLGIDYLHQGRLTQMHTANGTADAYLVTVASVKVGNIEVNQVQAAVLPAFRSDKILLGVSFLNNVAMTHEGQVMLLQKK